MADLTFAQLQRERKAALREVRRVQRATDTQIERIERRLFVLLDRKTLITRDVAMAFVPMWNKFFSQVKELERALADFISVTSI
ncbi:hypothetical protein ES705_42519 [subsurface metagenome]